MIVPDVNLLVYAFRKEYPRHAAARAWLMGVLEGPEPVGLHGMVECAFLRLCTKKLGSLEAAPSGEAVEFLGTLRSAAMTRPAVEGPEHQAILAALIKEHGLSGDGMNDAWLAAVAIEHEATLASADAGFSKYKDLRWINPVGQQ